MNRNGASHSPANSGAPCRPRRMTRLPASLRQRIIAASLTAAPTVRRRPLSRGVDWRSGSTSAARDRSPPRRRCRCPPPTPPRRPERQRQVLPVHEVAAAGMRPGLFPGDVVAERVDQVADVVPAFVVDGSAHVVHPLRRRQHRCGTCSARRRTWLLAGWSGSTHRRRRRYRHPAGRSTGRGWIIANPEPSSFYVLPLRVRRHRCPVPCSHTPAWVRLLLGGPAVVQLGLKCGDPRLRLLPFPSTFLLGPLPSPFRPLPRLFRLLQCLAPLGQ